MNTLTFSENSEGYLIPSEDGKALSHLTQPQTEAENWVSAQDFSFSREIVVLGLGTGFHIRALKEMQPSLKVHVIDTRDALLPIYRKQISSELENYYCMRSLEELLDSELFTLSLRKNLPVYSFLPCWAAQDDLFYSFWKNLTGRSLYGVVWHFANMGIELDERSLESFKSQKTPMSIKEATEIITQNPSELAQESRSYFEALRELIR